jgi:hypothetical protein
MDLGGKLARRDYVDAHELTAYITDHTPKRAN